MEKFKIEETGINFIPRFVRNVSDFEYGDTVDHEEFNEGLNLNASQGDYNTEILHILFMEEDPTKVPHVKYLDKIVTDAVNTMSETVDNVAQSIAGYDQKVTALDESISETTQKIQNIIVGASAVGLANKADNITNVDLVGAHKYYGTNYDNEVGFHDVPDSLYAQDMSVATVEIGGIYYTPRKDSVDETMLTDAVREKLNRQSIVSYPELSDLPSIEDVELKGNITLADIGAQPAGQYLTEIPEEYVVTGELEDAIAPFLTTDAAAETYVTNTLFNTTTDSLRTDANKGAIVCVGTFSGTPKTGDILISV